MQKKTKTAMDEEDFVSFDALQLRALIGRVDAEMLRVLIAAMMYVNEQGMYWPGQQELARVTGMRIEKVKAALTRLEAAGLVKRVREDEWVCDPDNILSHSVGGGDATGKKGAKGEKGGTDGSI